MTGTIKLTFTVDTDRGEIHCQRHSNLPIHREQLVYTKNNIHPVRSYLSPEHLKAWDEAREQLGWPIQKGS